MERRFRRLMLAGCAAGWILTARLADGWIYYGGSGYFTDVASDAAGDLVAGGEVLNNARVVKVDGSSGAELWRWNGASDPAGVALAIDPAGAVIVFVRYASQLHGFRALKLDGDSGAVLWDVHYDSGSFPEGPSLSLSPAGDVFLAFTQYELPAGQRHLVVKLAGADGTELWRYEAASIAAVAAVGDDLLVATYFGVVRLDGAGGSEVWQWAGESVRELVVDAAGNALLSAGQDPETIVRLSGADGTQLWSHALPSDVSIYDKVVDAAGHLVAVGQIGSPIDAYAVKLDIATGDELWSAVDTAYTQTLGRAVAVNSAGQAYVGGWRRSYGIDMRVWKHAASNGTTLWARNLVGAPATVSDVAYDIIVTPADDPVVAGTLGDAAALIKLDPAGGDCNGINCPETLDTGVITVGEKFRKRWLWGMKATGSPLSLPPPFSESDPVAVGMSIELSNPTTGERATFNLPGGANWAYLGASGAAPGDKGYLYQDKEGRNGPCTQAKMVPGKALKLTCTTGDTRLDPPFTLNEATQGALRVRLQMGEFRYCLSTEGGMLVKDRATVEGGQRGLFKVKNAPAPASCP